MNKALVWEDLGSGEFRAKVLGGWIVRVIDDVGVWNPGREEFMENYYWPSSLCFVPDVNHEWLKENKL